jgi:thiosulfate/3-mercaptopyruvate sulfurtransferase
MFARIGLLTALVAPLLAQSGNPSVLVSTDWLAGHLRDESLVILHAGSQKDYEAGHIPGARLVTLGDISITDERGLTLELPPADALEAAFGRLGITEGARIVVYAGTASVQSATRVWFTLDYLGFDDRAALLDGGLALWRAQQRPLATEASQVVNTTLTAHPNRDLIVDAQWIRTHLDDRKVQIVDARTPEYFSGASAGMMPRAGHIPGARSVPYTTLFEKDGRLKPALALREMLNAPGGAQPALTVSYCHVGQQATVLYFVARYLGIDARLYDGSFQDWSRRSELPVEPAPQ